VQCLIWSQSNASTLPPEPLIISQWHGHGVLCAPPDDARLRWEMLARAFVELPIQVPRFGTHILADRYEHLLKSQTDIEIEASSVVVDLPVGSC
jgi:hypothetical protein